MLKNGLISSNRDYVLLKRKKGRPLGSLSPSGEFCKIFSRVQGQVFLEGGASNEQTTYSAENLKKQLKLKTSDGKPARWRLDCKARGKEKGWGSSCIMIMAPSGLIRPPLFSGQLSPPPPPRPTPHSPLSPSPSVYSLPS